MTKLHILHVMWPERPGSTGGKETHLPLLMQLEAKQGHDTVAMLLRSSDLAKKLGKIGLPVVSVSLYRAISHIRGLLSDPMWKRNCVIHSHGYQASYFLMAMCCVGGHENWESVPRVVTLHGWIRHSITLKALTSLDFKSLPLFDHYICVCRRIQEELIENGIPDNRTSVIRYALAPVKQIGDRAGARRRLGLQITDYVVAGIGRLAREKRFDILIRACAEAAATIPNLRCLIVGSGPEERSLRSLIRLSDGLSQRYDTDLRCGRRGHHFLRH